ncbi:hypothetical protein VTG60DRAFT_6630 [Thermothelomyces hinnuleus]
MYDHFDREHVKILRRAWSEAPHLFDANPPTRPDIQNPVVRVRGKRSAPGSGHPERNHPRTLPDSPIPDRLQDQPSQAISASPLSPTAVNLVGTYSYENAVRVLGSGDGFDRQLGDGSCGVFARVFLAIERSDHKVEIQQLFRRACCYTFAQLHNSSPLLGNWKSGVLVDLSDTFLLTDMAGKQNSTTNGPGSAYILPKQLSELQGAVTLGHRRPMPSAGRPLTSPQPPPSH